MACPPRTFDQFTVDVVEHRLSAGQRLSALSDMTLQTFQNSLSQHWFFVGLSHDLSHPFT